jgi:hypothetical protein
LATVTLMVELIGTTTRTDLSWLKKLLLVFDRVALDRLSFHVDDVAHVQRLVEQRILFDVGYSNMPPDAPKHWLGAMGDAGRAQARLHIARLQARMGQPVDDLTPLQTAVQNAEARAMAITLRERDKLNAVPITEGWTPIPDEQVSKVEVIQLLLKEIPVPSDSHSLADVLAFRDEARGLTQGLRVWMNDMASGTLTGVDVSDKLEYLVNEYERALTLERMTRTTTWLETFIFPAKGVVEYLTTLASHLFTVRRAEIDLMKAEMTLPGREVAYIVRARERFEAPK